MKGNQTKAKYRRRSDKNELEEKEMPKGALPCPVAIQCHRMSDGVVTPQIGCQAFFLQQR